jgi:large subunit ribosomal protein L5
MENPMRALKIDKLTLNIGAGKDQVLLEKGVKLINNLTGKPGLKTVTNKRIPGWGIRPGLPIGCKLTLRGAEAEKMIKRLLVARSNKIDEKMFDNEGNVAFGIRECIDIEGAKYDPEIGIMGLEACITLKRAGFRIKKRKLMKRRLPLRHRISRMESVDFMKKKFNIKTEEE